MTSATAPERLESLVSACSAITATSAATKTRWSTSAAGRLKTRTSSSTASSASGGISGLARATRAVAPLLAARRSTASCAPRTAAVRAKLGGSALRARKVERSGTGSERLRAQHVEALVEALLEPVGPAVGVVSGPLPRQQSAGHRVFG